MGRWTWLAAAIASEVTGSLSLKAALQHPAFYVLVASGLGTAAVIFARLLRSGFNLGLIYGIWSAAGVALTCSLSALLYHEPMGPRVIAGLVLLALGVLLVELGAAGGPALASSQGEDS